MGFASGEPSEHCPILSWASRGARPAITSGSVTVATVPAHERDDG